MEERKDFLESDWKLYRIYIGSWQERYIERLCKEYIALLSQNTSSAERFWELKKRLDEDKRKPGVIVEMRRSSMLVNVARLLNDQAIDMSDLEPFSEEFKESIKIMRGQYYLGE